VPTVVYTLPLRLVSEANSRDQWWVRDQRRRKQMDTTALLLRCKIQPFCEQFRKGAVVTITRVGPRKLDSDNCVGSAKFVRDSIAKLIGIDDGSDLIEWRVDQDKGPYAVRVRIETRDLPIQVESLVPTVVDPERRRTRTKK
jgi:hypothetical protein